MKKLLILTLMASCYGAPPAGTSHDDPISGENGSVRLYFETRTQIAKTLTQMLQHTHDAVNWLVVDPGNGQLRRFKFNPGAPLAPRIEITLARAVGSVYQPLLPGPHIVIRRLNMPGGGSSLGAHREKLIELAQRCRMPRLPVFPREPGPREMERFVMSFCPQVRREASELAKDLDLVWETAVVNGFTLAPAAVTNSTDHAGAKREMYRVQGSGHVRMWSIRVIGSTSDAIVPLGADEKARFTVCSTEKVAHDRSCDLAPWHQEN